jgi:meso-butanediol dehydrogenase/(S,S)-butanediol dehydrogenase/diacetyl reductase
VSKCAIVTGGARGIGEATVSTLLSDGWKVHVLDRDQDGLDALEQRFASVAGPGLVSHVIDISDREAIADLAGVICENDRVEVLINNAATAVASTLPATSRVDWDRIFAINVHSAYELCRILIPHMAAHGGGVIVNVASTAALVGIADRAAYCASKGAIVALTRALAVDHAKDNIRVNAICPGTTETAWIGEILSSHPEPEGARRGMERRQLLGRLGEPGEIAHGIKFLIENSFATGSHLVVDGGMTAT